MKYTHLFCTLLAVASVLAGCKKEEEKSRTDKLTGKNWKIVASNIDPQFNGSNNYFLNLEDCETDNLNKFSKAFKYEEDEGGARCPGTTAQIKSSGTWSWVSNETIIRIVYDAGAGTKELTVDELSDGRLKVHYNATDQAGKKYVLTDTFEPR